MDLTRTQILNGTYVYPSDLIKLKPTKHFIERLEERGIGLDCIPTLVRVTKDNIHSGKTDDGKELVSVVVRLKYSTNRYVFLAFNPIDGGLKTLWFREKGGKNGDRGSRSVDSSTEQAVRDAGTEDEVL
jgi:hypothetical protein